MLLVIWCHWLAAEEENQKHGPDVEDRHASFTPFVVSLDVPLVKKQHFSFAVLLTGTLLVGVSIVWC